MGCAAAAIELGSPDQWELKGEGGANLVFGYCSTTLQHLVRGVRVQGARRRRVIAHRHRPPAHARRAGGARAARAQGAPVGPPCWPSSPARAQRLGAGAGRAQRRHRLGRAIRRASVGAGVGLVAPPAGAPRARPPCTAGRALRNCWRPTRPCWGRVAATRRDAFASQQRHQQQKQACRPSAVRGDQAQVWVCVQL